MRCENADALTDGRLVSPSAERNKAPIGEVLKRVLPASGLVLEISSGTGQHVVHFARAMPSCVWQPTERDPDCLRSIAAWLAAEALENVKAPRCTGKVLPLASMSLGRRTKRGSETFFSLGRRRRPRPRNCPVMSKRENSRTVPSPFIGVGRGGQGVGTARFAMRPWVFIWTK